MCKDRDGDPDDRDRNGSSDALETSISAALGPRRRLRDEEGWDVLDRDPPGDAAHTSLSVARPDEAAPGRYATAEVIDPRTDEVRHAVVNTATGKILASYADAGHATHFRDLLAAGGVEPGAGPLSAVPACRPWCTHSLDGRGSVKGGSDEDGDGDEAGRVEASAWWTTYDPLGAGRDRETEPPPIAAILPVEGPLRDAIESLRDARRLCPRERREVASRAVVTFLHRAGFRGLASEFADAIGRSAARPMPGVGVD